MKHKSKDSTTAVKVVCAMLFFIFTFFYVYSFQHGLLEMIQYAWSDGKTHYDQVIGAVIITAVMTLLSFAIYALTSLPQRVSTLIYFPALLLLGLMTAVDVNGKSVTTSTTCLLITLALLILYACVLPMAKKSQPFLVPLRATSFLSQPWWVNAFLLAAMMVMTYAMGNTDRTLHTRLEVEYHCMHKEWDKALEEGIPEYDNDSSLTMLRAMALANKNELGEMLFTYDVKGGSRALFPQQENSVCFLMGNGYGLWQTIGVVPRDFSKPVVDILKQELRRGTVKPVAKDYLLCAYLLDKDLKSFVTELPKYYTINDSMPKHYREAVVLYMKKYNKVVAKNITEKKEIEPYKDAPLEADYADFLAVMRSYRNKVQRHSALRDAYFGTYWYYYLH